MKHWIMNDPGGPSQDGVNAAFAQAIAESRPVVYAWYMHERDDMHGLVASAHGMLQTAAAANPGVPFEYVTAQEAMRAVIGTTDVTPPVLTVAHATGDNYTITSSETLLGDGPYVAARYGAGTGAVYAHGMAVTPSGTNSWTASLPSSNGGLPLELVGAGALDLAGNSAVARVGASSLVAAVVPEGACISTAHATVAVAVNYTRIEATPVRAYSVVLHLGGGLALGGAGVVQGNYLKPVGNPSFQVADRGNGVYEVDETLLGATSGATGDGTLFTLNVGSGAASGTGTVTIDSVRVRDCDNNAVSGVPGPVGAVTIDNTAPVAASGLAAQAAGAGTVAGLRKVAVTFTPPSDGSRVEVWRKGYGNYPQYGTGATPGAVPGAPGSYPPAGWALTGVTASGGLDEPPARDAWYYVAYAIDGCGNATASNLTGGTLDYLLGDVADGVAECAGDNAVSMLDVSLLGAHYGAEAGSGDYLACLDVGPTVGYSLTGRPEPDGVIEFEDLVLFALNFRAGTAPLAGARPAVRTEGQAVAADALALELPALPAVGGNFTVPVQATASGIVHALQLELGYDHGVVEMEGVEAGELLGRQGAQALVLTPKPGRVDVALLGPGAGLSGSGELVRVRFRVTGVGAAALTLKSAEGRDGANRKVALNAQVGAMPPPLPTRTSFSSPAPNPFSGTTTLSFALARGGAVELAVYGIDGRKVTTLVAEARAAGQYQVTWDGRDGTGRAVRPGMYYARLLTPDGRFTRTLVLMR